MIEQDHSQVPIRGASVAWRQSSRGFRRRTTKPSGILVGDGQRRKNAGKFLMKALASERESITAERAWGVYCGAGGHMYLSRHAIA